LPDIQAAANIEVEEQKEVFFNITSISETAKVKVKMDNPIKVPDNYTDLPPSIFDVKYICNSEDPIAQAQNFTYNLTSISPQELEIDLFFSDPLHVSSDSNTLDEIIILLEKDFFAQQVFPDQRDLRWAYNNTDSSRDDYLELRESIRPLVADEEEAKILATAGAVVTSALIVSVGIPLSLQFLLKAAMSKVWSIFNTL